MISISIADVVTDDIVVVIVVKSWFCVQCSKNIFLFIGINIRKVSCLVLEPSENLTFLINLMILILIKSKTQIILEIVIIIIWIKFNL